MYHAAEDFHRPAGTPVYAMADGEVSFSGRMGGYGWLVIVDHPQANIYSLYGHLSPSRWYIQPGLVEKGQLIGYLGDPDENGGSAKNPLVTHLHLGVRAGQRADYPGKGEWRWMAGWIKPCPVELGWLKPSTVINNQEIPPGGFQEPDKAFFTMWWIELLFSVIYAVGATGSVIFAVKRDRPYTLFVAGAVLSIAAWIFYRDGWKMTPALFIMAILLFVIGIYLLLGRTRAERSANA